MQSSFMTSTYQSDLNAPTSAPWLWSLAPHQVRSLPATAVPRWLRVDTGRVWVTQRRSDAPAEDLWLQAGESLALPAGTAWIVEAWPRAQLSLLQAAPAAGQAAPWGRAWERVVALLRGPLPLLRGLA